MDNATAVKQLTYRLEVTVTQRLSDDPDDPDYPTVEGATTPTFKREIERDVLNALYRLGRYGQKVAGVELMDFAVKEGK